MNIDDARGDWLDSNEASKHLTGVEYQAWKGEQPPLAHLHNSCNMYAWSLAMSTTVCASSKPFHWRLAADIPGSQHLPA
jgi:hypothetical protein